MCVYASILAQSTSSNTERMEHHLDVYTIFYQYVYMKINTHTHTHSTVVLTLTSCEVVSCSIPGPGSFFVGFKCSGAAGVSTADQKHARQVGGRPQKAPGWECVRTGKSWMNEEPLLLMSAAWARRRPNPHPIHRRYNINARLDCFAHQP